MTRAPVDAPPYADLAATKRSICRYLRRYEREWYDDKREVSTYVNEMTGCRPPEEGGAVLIKGRVIRALTELRHEGLIEASRGPMSGHMRYGLTPLGRETVEYEATPR